MTADLQSVAAGEGVFVAVGAEGTLLRSIDHGRSWEDRSNAEVSTDLLTDVAYGNGVFLATAGGYVLISEDQGRTWRRAADLTDFCNGLAFGNGRWVAACQGALLASTSNGASWDIVYDPSAEVAGADVLYANHNFLVVGGSIQLSTDFARSFTDVGHDYTSWLADTAYGNDRYVIIGGLFGNLVLQSANPAEWPTDSATELEGVQGLAGIAFGNGRFVLAADNGKLLVSNGPSSWQAVTSGVDANLRGATYHDGTFVVVGDAGTILISGRPPEINSPLTTSGTVGESLTYSITALYGPTGFDATGLPGGLAINRETGVISGIPVAVGTFSATLTASNPYGSDSRELTLVIHPAGSGVDFRVNIHTAVELEWSSRTGKSYQVQASPDLKSWSNHESPIPGTGGMIYRLYSTRDPARRFYRVQEL